MIAGTLSLLAGLVFGCFLFIWGFFSLLGRGSGLLASWDGHQRLGLKSWLARHWEIARACQLSGGN